MSLDDPTSAGKRLPTPNRGDVGSMDDIGLDELIGFLPLGVGA